MIGSLDPKKKNVTVVGGGISGLLIAYTLKKRGFQVKVLEAGPRVGGLIQTLNTPHGPVEMAAHSLLVSPEVQALFDELSIPLVDVNPKSKARFIYRNGKSRRLPLRFFEILITLYHLFTKPKFAFDSSSGTLAEWCTSYLGRPALRYLLSPFVTGVFAATPQELNAKITFPRLVPNRPDFSFFRWIRSLPKSPRSKMRVPLQGMQSLVTALEQNLKNEIQLNSPLHDLNQISDSENIVLTVPAAELSKLLAKTDSRSAEQLLQVQYAPLVTITMFFKESAFRSQAPKGVGVLIPRNEGLRILGVLYNSSSFSHRVSQSGICSLSVMIGGTTDPEAIQLSDEALDEILRVELDQLLGAKDAPLKRIITRWQRAIPVYSNSLKQAQDALKEGYCSTPGRVVFSNYSKEVSIRGLINALHNL